MLRNARFMKMVLGISPRTVIHVGADRGQDRNAYISMGVREIIWCEADPESADVLRRDYPTDKIISALFWDRPNKEVIFYQTTNSAQNSAIPPSEDSKIGVQKQIKLMTTSLDTHFKDFNFESPLMVVIDVQGAEEKVLQGGVTVLKKVKYAVIEVALSSQGYIHTPSEDSIDSIMTSLNFRKSLFRTGRSEQYKDQLFVRASSGRLMMIKVTDFVYNKLMCARHKVVKGHKIKTHYHCLKCEF
jgi:FkbM family methyltransferase